MQRTRRLSDVLNSKVDLNIAHRARLVRGRVCNNLDTLGVRVRLILIQTTLKASRRVYNLEHGQLHNDYKSVWIATFTHPDKASSASYPHDKFASEPMWIGA